MTAAISSAALVAVAPVFGEPERLALAGFLASCTGLTREAYMLDLRQFAAWCHQRDLVLFGVRRADIECFARDLEARGRARSTVSRRLATIAGFCKYAVQEGLLDHSPAAHVRRPRLDYESHAVALDRNEAGALLVAAGVQRGHRTLTIVRKGGKKAVVPLAPRTARAIDLTVGERCQGPIFLTAAGTRLDRHGAGGSCGASPGALDCPSRLGLTPSGMRHGRTRRQGATARCPRSRLPRCGVLLGLQPIRASLYASREVWQGRVDEAQ